jgi:hypothetical protein
MKNKSEVQFAETGNRQGDTSASKPVDRHPRFLRPIPSKTNFEITTSAPSIAQEREQQKPVYNGVGVVNRILATLLRPRAGCRVKGAPRSGAFIEDP